MNKKNKKFFFFIFIATALAVTTNFGLKDGLVHNSTEEIASSVEQVSLSRNEQNIRSAAVKVVDVENRGHGSGSYFVVNSRHIVITAAHVVDTADIFKIVGNYGEISIGKVIYRNDESDFAVLGVQRMDSVRPMRLKTKDRTRTQLIGENVFFSGFPAAHSTISTRGMIVGFENGNSFILVHSYAWRGSSGSCVFDKSGSLLGVLTGLDVGMFEVPQLTEDMIWVSSIRPEDIVALMEVLE
jgi:S1-C subfamily serine protease